MASSTRSGTGVGPAVSRYSFIAYVVFRRPGGVLLQVGRRADSLTPSAPSSKFFHRMSLAQFADASFGYPGNEILTGASLLIRPGRPAGAARAERHRQVDRAAPAGGRPRARRGRRARARAAPASPTCASRRSVAARARCSTRCSSRSPTLQKLHDEMVALEARLARRRRRRRWRATASCRSATSARAATSSSRA